MDRVIVTFDSAHKFRAWLKANHKTTAELLVRCYQTQAKDKGLTYRQNAARQHQRKAITPSP